MVKTRPENEKRVSLEGQVKAQLIELIQARLAEFIREEMSTLEENHQPEDEDGFLYEAVKQMGWTGNKVGLDNIHLSVKLSVYLEDEHAEDHGVSYVRLHLCPQVRVEEGDGDGLSDQVFTGCGSVDLDLRVV